MHHSIDAIYDGGVFRPLDVVPLADQQRVRLIVECPQEAAERELAEWQQVYSGLTDEEIGEIEKLVKDRTHFMRPQG